MSSKERLLELNARLAQNLTDKGVEATADETTTALVNKVADIQVADDFRILYWSEFQQNGERVDFNNAFANLAFTEKTFYPIFDIRPTTANNIFRSSKMKISLPQRLEECEIVLDFSNCGGTPDNAFAYSYFTELPECDFSNRTSIQDTFAGMLYLQKIPKLIVSEITNNYWNTFAQCYALTYIRIEGVIVVGQVNINLSVCPLDAESAISVITHLENVFGTDKAYIKAVVFSTTTLALLEAEGNTAPGGMTWIEYIDSLGWNT